MKVIQEFSWTTEGPGRALTIRNVDEPAAVAAAWAHPGKLEEKVELFIEEMPENTSVCIVAYGEKETEHTFNSKDDRIWLTKAAFIAFHPMFLKRGDKVVIGGRIYEE